jgi:hypothetical protein
MMLGPSSMALYPPSTVTTAGLDNTFSTTSSICTSSIISSRKFFLSGPCHLPNTNLANPLNSRIPFYHAAEATAAIKPLLGKRYISERGSFHMDLWNSFRQLHWMEAQKTADGKGTLRVWNTNERYSKLK